MVKSRRFSLGTAKFSMLTAMGLIFPSWGANAEVAPSPARLCQDDPSRTASALTFLVCTLRDGLPPLDSATVIVSRPLSDSHAEGGRLFGERLTGLLSSATGAHDGGLAPAAPGAAPVASQASGSDPGALSKSIPLPAPAAGLERPLLLLEPRLVGNRLSVDATLFGKRANVWARARGETNQILAHSFAAKALDAELRSYLPKVPLIRPKLQAYGASLTQINAIACGDPDDDGALDIAIANRQDVAWGSITVEGFVPRHVAPLSELSPVAPVPLREPLASLFFNGPRLELSSTDRQYWVQLDPQLTVIDKRPNAWGIAAGWCTSRGRLPPQTAPFACASAPPLQEATAAALDREVVWGTPLGDAQVRAWRDANSGGLTVQMGAQSWTLPGCGSQIALDDLNHDGVLEVITTSGTLQRGDDHVSVYSLLRSKHDPELIWQVPVAAGVDALAVCPPEPDTQSAIVIASNNYVGVLQ